MLIYKRDKLILEILNAFVFRSFLKREFHIYCFFVYQFGKETLVSLHWFFQYFFQTGAGFDSQAIFFHISHLRRTRSRTALRWYENLWRVQGNHFYFLLMPAVHFWTSVSFLLKLRFYLNDLYDLISGSSFGSTILLFHLHKSYIFVNNKKADAQWWQIYL